MKFLTTSAVALCLAAPAAAQVEVEFWHAFSGNNGEAVGELAAQFNAAQDDYEIVPVYTGNYTEGTQRLTAAIAGNTAPGLVMLEITRYGLFADRGALAPLQPYLDASGDELVARIRPFALEASRYLGESYVIPFNVSTPVFYYNRDAFRAAGLDPDAPPATWEAWLAAAQALTIRDDAGNVTQWGMTTPPQWGRWAMTNQAGGGWIDPADNAVRTRCCRHLEGLAAPLVDLRRCRQVERGVIAADLHRFDRLRGWGETQHHAHDEQAQYRPGASGCHGARTPDWSEAGGVFHSPEPDPFARVDCQSSAISA